MPITSSLVVRDDGTGELVPGAIHYVEDPMGDGRDLAFVYPVLDGSQTPPLLDDSSDPDIRWGSFTLEAARSR